MSHPNRRDENGRRTEFWDGRWDRRMTTPQLLRYCTEYGIDVGSGRDRPTRKADIIAAIELAVPSEGDEL